MKKIAILVAAMAILPGLANAQDAQSAAAAAAAALSNAPKTEIVKKPVYWTNSVEFNLGFNQTGLWDWAAGGYNTVSLAASIDAKADYKKDLMSWNNRLQLNYGFLWSADKKELLQKSTDRIYLESKWAYDLFEKSKWKYTASFDFRSQFTDSYDEYTLVGDVWSGKLKSGFLSPAYTNLALGMEWKPNDWFDLNIAPVTGGFTIVTNSDLRQAYGMHLTEEGLDPLIGTNYKNALFQFGAQVKANAKATINDKFTYETQLVLFYDYINKPVYTGFPVRVNWDNAINWKLSKLFKVGFNTWLIYDPNITIIRNGEATGRDRIQFKEFIAINFTYSIQNKK